MKRPAFNQGRAEGLVSVSETRLKMPGIMASQGFAPTNISEDLQSAIRGTAAVDYSPEMLSAREAGGEPVVNPDLYKGLDLRTIYGMTYAKPKKEVAQKAAKTDYPGTLKVQTDEGDLEIKLTTQQLAERLSKLGAPATNAAPALEVKGVWKRDPINGKLVLTK
jgi:hypothetical protein